MAAAAEESKRLAGELQQAKEASEAPAAGSGADVELESTQMRLKDAQNRVSALEVEATRRQEELEALRAEVATARTERDRAADALSQAQADLATLRAASSPTAAAAAVALAPTTNAAQQAEANDPAPSTEADVAAAPAEAPVPEAAAPTPAPAPPMAASTTPPRPSGPVPVAEPSIQASYSYIDDGGPILTYSVNILAEATSPDSITEPIKLVVQIFGSEGGMEPEIDPSVVVLGRPFTFDCQTESLGAIGALRMWHETPSLSRLLVKKVTVINRRTREVFDFDTNSIVSYGEDNAVVIDEDSAGQANNKA